MMTDDFITEETEFLSRFLKTILFPQSSQFSLEEYPFIGSAADLQAELIQLTQKKEFCKAEDLLFLAIEQDTGEESLQVAVWFYHHLSLLDAKELEAHDFSMDEVLEGLQEIERRAVAR